MALIKATPFNPVGTGETLNTFYILFGTATTRAQVLADWDTSPAHQPCAIGSLYCSTAGKLYVKVSQGSPAVATDWQRATTTAAD